MKTILLKPCSVPLTSPALSGSSAVSPSCQSTLGSSLHFTMDKRKSKEICAQTMRAQIRRAFSVTDIVRSDYRCFSGEKCESDGEEDREFKSFDMENGSDMSFSPILLEFGISNEEIRFSGDGFEISEKSKDCNKDVWYTYRSKIGDHYRQNLEINPTDHPLLLRNYGRFLYEVENDMESAEYYYGRAILESPQDGEILSLYGELIWERDRDESRAKSYFDRAITASPHDCTVMGSSAHFMWEAEDIEEEEVGDDGCPL